MSILLFNPPPRQTIYRHTIVWLLIVIYYFIFTITEGSIFVKSVWIFGLIVNYSISYYTLLLIIWPKFIQQKKHFYILLTPVLIALSFIIFYFQSKTVIPYLGGTNPMQYWTFNEFLHNVTKLFLYVFFSSIGSYYNWFGSQLIREDIEIDKKIIEMEFLFLKNQFHSHLTFNFLNFCYNKVRKSSLSVANSFEDFADVLKFALNKNSVEPVSLEQELKYVNDCISFYESFDSSLNIKISCTGDTENSYLLPRTLSIFLENHFWIKKNNELTTSIDINIASIKDLILFSITYQKGYLQTNHFTPELNVINHVLNLLYINNYRLNVIDHSDFIKCELRINKILNFGKK